MQVRLRKSLIADGEFYRAGLVMAREQVPECFRSWDYLERVEEPEGEPEASDERDRPITRLKKPLKRR